MGVVGDDLSKTEFVSMLHAGHSRPIYIYTLSRPIYSAFRHLRCPANWLHARDITIRRDSKFEFPNCSILIDY